VTTDERLWRHRPALVYDPQEPYRILSAASITDHPGNLLVRFDGAVLARAGGQGAARLTLALLSNYPDGLRAKAGDRLDEAADELAAARVLQGDPVYAGRVYGRVATDGDLTWLQYWLWFYYNPKHLLGLGRHEGDWELVQVGLAADGSPAVVTGSQHETGEARRFEDVRTHRSADGVHPVVFVAPFSHANYFEPGAKPYLGGVDHPSNLLAPALPAHVEPLGHWATWPGRWGNSDGILAPLSRGRLGGRSPASPARQGDRWRRPARYHEQAVERAPWRTAAAGVRQVGRLTYPRLASLEAELHGQLLTVRYALERSPLRPARFLYVTVHDEDAADEVLLSQVVDIAGRRSGQAEFLLPRAPSRCLVRASAFNRARQRSDPRDARAVQAD
jgi:hypothetical protein